MNFKPDTWSEIPDDIRRLIFSSFFDENDKEIVTFSQYHTETMWQHMKMCFAAFRRYINKYNNLFSENNINIIYWGLLLHDIAKPISIVEKHRKICNNCFRPNVPIFAEKNISNCLRCNSKKLEKMNKDNQLCCDCGKVMPFISEEKENKICYFCNGDLSENIIIQHGWHNHDKIGSEYDFLMPICKEIGLEDDFEKIRRFVRYHSIVHARIHKEFNSKRYMNEKNKKQSVYKYNLTEEFGFDPFSFDFKDTMYKFFHEKELIIGAILLSCADDNGKISPISEDKFSDEFVDFLIMENI